MCLNLLHKPSIDKHTDFAHIGLKQYDSRLTLDCERNEIRLFQYRVERGPGERDILNRIDKRERV